MQDFGSISELIAAVATIVTLFYLALQIRQSTLTSRAAALDAILSEWRTFEREVFIHNQENVDLWRKGLSDFNALDANGKTVFHFILAQKIHCISNMQQQFKNGNISKKNLDPWMDYIASVLRAPGGAAWWKEVSGAFDPEFVGNIDQRIQLTRHLPNFIERADFLPYEKPT